MEKMLGRGEKMKVNYGSYIRKQAMKNLLSQYCPTLIDTIALIALTKYIMRISHKFDDEILDLGSDTERASDLSGSRSDVARGGERK